MKIQTKDYGDGILDILKYSNGRTAIRIRGDEGASIIATLTVNLPDKPINKDEFFVKTWSENAQIAKDCMNSGLFIDTGKRVHTGWAEAAVWKFK